MDDAGLGFLLMLRRNMGITDTLLNTYASEVRSSANYIAERDQYAKTVSAPLFDGDPTVRYFHIIWDPALETRHRKCLYNEVENCEKRILKLIERKTQISEEEASRYGKWFSLKIGKPGP